MKKSLGIGILLILATGSASGCSRADTEPVATEKTEVIVSAAASLAAPLASIKLDLEREQPDLRVTINLGSSGSLQKQIEQGAPADLFWSAASKQMDELQQKGLLLADTRVDAAGNELVLIAPTGRVELQDVDSFADLTQESVKKIGIGSPETVPVGTYGQQVLQKTKVWDAVQSKLVYGKDVKQVLTYVERGDVDAGIVYGSDAHGTDNIQVLAKAEGNSHQPIRYPIAVLKSSRHPDAARRVLTYIQSDHAQDILVQNGFAKGVKGLHE